MHDSIKPGDYAIKEYARLKKITDNLPRVQRPRYIRPGVSWTTKESNAYYGALLDLSELMTRDELRTAISIAEANANGNESPA